MALLLFHQTWRTQPFEAPYVLAKELDVVGTRITICDEVRLNHPPILNVGQYSLPQSSARRLAGLSDGDRPTATTAIEDHCVTLQRKQNGRFACIVSSSKEKWASVSVQQPIDARDGCSEECGRIIPDTLGTSHAYVSLKLVKVF